MDTNLSMYILYIVVSKGDEIQKIEKRNKQTGERAGELTEISIPPSPSTSLCVKLAEVLKIFKILKL